MNAIKQRIAELAIIGRHRPLNHEEAAEWEESRQALTNHEWKVARIFNLMYVARVIGDWDQHMELYKELKRLEGVES